MTTQALLNIRVALLGNRFSAPLWQQLCDHPKLTRIRDALRFDGHDGEAYVFEYGVLVAWNLSDEELNKLNNWMLEQVQERESRPFVDQFKFQHSTQDFRVQHDCLWLDHHRPLIKLALSHALAQSAKLEQFEAQAQQMIQDNGHITKELAQHGKVKLNRKQLAKLRGQLFDTSSDISLHFNLLDTPEFFWDYPELEQDYMQLARYLDLKPRIELLNHKLATIGRLLDMLADEQNHKHSAFLEWIIIILIAVDIVLYFFH